MSNVILDCGLCGQRGLHINKISSTESVRQCISCGYATNESLKGTK